MSQAMPQATIRISGFSFYRPRLFPVLVSIVLVSVLALLFVWSRIHAINLEYDVSKLEMEIRQQQQQIKELKLESAYLSRDERIADLADKLGLRAPTPGQVIRVN
jgi:cell division protein FtsL